MGSIFKILLLAALVASTLGFRHWPSSSGSQGEIIHHSSGSWEVKYGVQPEDEAKRRDPACRKRYKGIIFFRPYWPCGPTIVGG